MVVELLLVFTHGLRLMGYSLRSSSLSLRFVHFYKVRESSSSFSDLFQRLTNSWFILTVPPAVELSCSRRSSYVRHCHCFLSHRCLCTCDFNLSYSFIDPPMFVIEAMNWYHCLCMWWFLLDSRTNAYVFGDYIVSLFLRSWNYHGIQPWMHSRSCQPCVCGNAPVSVLELHTRCLCNYPRETWSFTLSCQAIF